MDRVKALGALRVAVTLVALAAAVWVGRNLWIHYTLDPWTRDGRVRAEVIQIAPDVSGLVTSVTVRDNQPVRKGQVLFVIDQPRFALALAQADAAVSGQRIALAQARREDRRNRALGPLVSAETVEQGAARVAQADAALRQAEANRDLARLNLDRTTVTAPVDGLAADVTLEPGDYASAGRPALGLIDVGSFRVDGYFEETKLAFIHVGDLAEVRLMGERAVIRGHVDSLSPGIEDRERAAGSSLLPNVNPTFSWIRLAQRVPVRIALDGPPPGLRLVAGRTATVVIRPRGGVRR